MSKVVTIILARIGSKRLTNKLLRVLKGKTLIEWTIEDALEIGYPVYVYTDSDIIKKVCEKYGVNVRPKLFENEEGIHHTGKEIIEYNKELNADYFILLQGTSPYRDNVMIKDYFDDFLKCKYDSAFSAYPITRGFFYDAYGNQLNYYMSDRAYNGATTNITYKETGSFYFFKKEMLTKKHFLSTTNKLMCIDKYDIDIDDIKELERAAGYGD